MLPSTTPSTPLSINQLVLLSYKRAGILPVEARIDGANMTPKLEHGRLLLDTILDALSADGFIARTLEVYDLPLVAGQPSYSLPEHILDAYGDAMVVVTELEDFDPNRTNGELAVKQVDVATWLAITNKEMESSRPQLYVSFRDRATAQVKLWPIPSDNAVLRLKVIRLFGSNKEGQRPIDLQRYWQDAIVWMLAYYLATDSSMPTERCVYLAQVSEAKKTAALRYAHEHTPITATLSYPTQWST